MIRRKSKCAEGEGSDGVGKEGERRAILSCFGGKEWRQGNVRGKKKSGREAMSYRSWLRALCLLTSPLNSIYPFVGLHGLVGVDMFSVQSITLHIRP